MRFALGTREITVLGMATGLITLVACIVAASTGNTTLSLTAVAIFALTSVACGWLLNAQATAAGGATQNVQAAHDNAAMMAGTFGWGGATILSSYYLTELFWHHAWQYGGAMVLFAAGMLAYAQLLRKPASRLRSRQMLKVAGVLAAIQAFAASAGLAFLISSGKLGIHKADWLANHVFLAGGLTIVVLSVFAAWAQLRPSHANFK